MKFVFYRKPKFSNTTRRPCGIKGNGVEVMLCESSSLIMLALFCHATMTDIELMEIRWPDIDTLPDTWSNSLRVQICQLNKRLALAGVRIISQGRRYRIIECGRQVLRRAA